MTDYPNNVASKMSKMLEDTISEALIEAVQNISIEIDEEELLKMLRDSKKQYRSGYNDGYNDRDSEIVRCKNCKWYDEQISMCDNCRLPREQTFFCADGKRRDDNG